MNRAMIRPHLQRSIRALEVQVDDLQICQESEMNSHGMGGDPRFGSGTVKHIRQLLLELQEHPTEAEVLEVYPNKRHSVGPDHSIDVILTVLRSYEQADTKISSILPR